MGGIEPAAATVVLCRDPVQTGIEAATRGLWSHNDKSHTSLNCPVKVQRDIADLKRLNLNKTIFREIIFLASSFYSC